MKWILLSLLLCSCAVKPKIEVNHPILGNVYNTFVLEANKRNVQIPNDLILTIFADPMMDSNMYGHCLMLQAEKYRLVRINKRKNFSYYELEEVLFHELGHCILGRGHYNAKDSLDNPISIMFQSDLVKDYEKNREAFLDELFNGGS